jgi:hypothetical protein
MATDDKRLGDAPIEEKYRELMNSVARMLDQIFNPDTFSPHERGIDPSLRKTGFVLLVFPFGDHEGRCNYISNGADRHDVVIMMKEQIKRFEGQPDVEGHA